MYYNTSSYICISGCLKQTLKSISTLMKSVKCHVVTCHHAGNATLVCRHVKAVVHQVRRCPLLRCTWCKTVFTQRRKVERSRCGDKEISSLLWNPKFNYRDHKASPLKSILTKLNPFNTFTQYSLRFLLLLSCDVRTGFSSGLLTYMLSYQDRV